MRIVSTARAIGIEIVAAFWTASSVASAGSLMTGADRLKTFPPRFVIAKGGITSSDVAAHGLEIRHAIVRGPMLPGIVSLWQPADGPARSVPFVVFAGNVGTDESLADVVDLLRSPAPSSSTPTGASHDIRP